MFAVFFFNLAAWLWLPKSSVALLVGQDSASAELEETCDPYMPAAAHILDCYLLRPYRR